MRRTLLRFAPLYTRNLLSPPNCRPNPISPAINVTSTLSKLRFFSSENDSSNESQPKKKEVRFDFEDISNKEFKDRIEKYLKGDEEMLPSIMEDILKRKLLGNHAETDDELIDELRHQPIDDVKDRDFESDFEELYSTDEEIDNLYNARQYVEKKMMKDEFFNMDDRKWDGMIKEAVEHGHLKDTKECEQILEDMLCWDNLLTDEVKQKVEAKFNELGDMCERGELEPEEAFEQFKEFEDKMVLECAKMMENEQPPQFDEITEPDKKKDIDDPPGEGPILRWQTRVVFSPGGDAWHPKNRKVKLSVTVKELELSKHAFRRLREVVGKRYHPGKDELTITSERFEHREENKKDCLRTLYALIEDAYKADKLVEDTRASYVKERLRANPEFMKRLRVKTMGMQASDSACV
ncbi:uncharacterized protein LOC122646604 isoform X2 [Telopea speciosissima]|uniref:uncharacterized protein LOC122646604 isoform X2 n=1 Tax=Telopea speciosissima TaxID=54955 RepID=UPI001CC53D11|nr:uncharacterized protein LOC122646604 isoform X2 [Telopea speciosissima]